jgi:putative FmdB family regulatory protein
MPVYIYQCESCGVRFDRYQKFTEQPLTWCPECGKKALRKVYSPVGIVFKGSGFYSTDHKSPSGASYKSDRAEEKAEEKAKESLKPAPEAKPAEAAKPVSETKPAETSEAKK